MDKLGGWLEQFARGRSTSVVPVPGGVAVLNADFPRSHDHNKLIVTSAVDPDVLADAAERVLGGAGLQHRLIDVHDAGLAERLGPGLAARGYTGAPDVLMAATGPATKALDRAIEVVELGLAERMAAASASWRRERPDYDDVTVEQLGRRLATVAAAARATFFAVRDASGQVVARTDLYERDGLAQIEDVMTEPGARGRGLASRLVLHALEQAREGGAEVVFLTADADDWPQKLYQRLGFTEVGLTATFRTVTTV